jgi:ABC-type branched-subunit amino acid transport system ATPase component
VILEAQDVRKLYGAYVALDGVSLSIREDEFVSIIGPNGAGKSTLINVLTGVLAPSAGRGTSPASGRRPSPGSAWRGASSSCRSSPS